MSVVSIYFLTFYVSHKKLSYHQEHLLLFTHVSHSVLAWFQTSIAAHISIRPQ